MRTLGIFIVAAIAFSTAGCQTNPTADKQPDLPTAAQLIAMHNRNVAPIKQLWARSVVEIDYKDEKGKPHHVQGEGHVILKHPSSAMMTIGKIGQTKFWAGSNADHYWLFDTLNGDLLYLGVRSDSPNRKALLAKIPANAKRITQAPLPVNPTQLSRLFGLVTISKDAIKDAVVTAEKENHVLDIPSERIRYIFAPKNYLGNKNNYLPIRIELLDKNQKVAITTRLSTPLRMTADNALLGPVINARSEITFTKGDAKLTLHLGDPTGQARKVNDRLFDLEVLKNINKPKTIYYITPKN